MSSYTIMCGKCGAVFDHNPKYVSHCLCKGCGVSISIPDSRRYYALNNPAHAQTAAGAAAPGFISGPSGAGRAIPADDLPPAVRDNSGQPVKAPATVNRSDTPHHGVDHFAFIRRRAEQIAKQTAERVAQGGPIEEIS